MKKSMILLACVALFSISCMSQYSRPLSSHKLMNDRFGTRYLAYEIYNNLRTPAIEGASIIVTTFVDLNDLEKTSVLGRVMAEKLLDEMNRRGFRVVEVRRSQDLFIKKAVGEMILSRDVDELGKNSNARAILAGTYVATANSLIVNARLIDINTPQILSSVSYEVVMTEEIQNLITGIAPF